jgi:hypothetical protein
MEAAKEQRGGSTSNEVGPACGIHTPPRALCCRSAAPRYVARSGSRLLATSVHSQAAQATLRSAA